MNFGEKSIGMYLTARFGRTSSNQMVYLYTTTTLSALMWIGFSPLNIPHTQKVLLTIQFLRYLQENVILLGIIPGPHEPKLNINAFLQPFVDELQQL